MWFNLLLFKVSWFGLVIFQNSFVAISLFLLGIHFLITADHKKELLAVITIASIGIAVDYILAYSGVFVFSNTSFIPFWLICLWLIFATTIANTLAFLSEKPLYQMLVGGTFAPLSYLAGAQMGSVSFGYSTTETYLILAAIWAPLLAAFFLINSKFSASGGDYVPS